MASEERNVRIIQEMYEAFGRGDVQAIVDRLSDDVRWLSHLDPVVPWSGDFSGKKNVPRFFAGIFDGCDVKSFEPTEWVADGDRVVSIGTFSCRGRKTGKEASARWVFLWTVKDGVVTAYEQFQDQEIAAAFR